MPSRSSSSPRDGGFVDVPATYMDKIAVGSGLPLGVVDLDEEPAANLEALAGAKGVEVADLVTCILDRPRHAELIAKVRAAGARIRLILDGDVSAALATCREGGVDVSLGVGGAAEGVLAASAQRCMGGQMQGRFVLRTDEEKARAAALGIDDVGRKYAADEMVQGHVTVAATGVTTGLLLAGVRRLDGVVVTPVSGHGVEDRDAPLHRVAPRSVRLAADGGDLSPDGDRGRFRRSPRRRLIGCPLVRGSDRRRPVPLRPPLGVAGRPTRAWPWPSPSVSAWTRWSGASSPGAASASTRPSGSSIPPCARCCPSPLASPTWRRRRNGSPLPSSTGSGSGSSATTTWTARPQPRCSFASSPPSAGAPGLHVPDRIAEGYGPNTPALLALGDAGVSIVVTVDCGTGAHEPLEAAARAGLDVIVVDHHAADSHLPRAFAVVNPKRLDDRSGQGQLAAVGVAFLLVVAVNRALREAGWYAARPEPDLTGWLDLVALGTVCDVVPLVGVNRALVRQGLRTMGRRRNAGLRALADVAGARRGAGHLPRWLRPWPARQRRRARGALGPGGAAPRLRRPGRGSRARPPPRRPQTGSGGRSRRRCWRRRSPGSRARTEAHADALVFVAGEGWHPGVIGIVAGRLKERYHRPACVVAIARDVGRRLGPLDRRRRASVP